MKFYNVSEFAKRIGKSSSSLRNWDRNGTLKPSYISPGGHRMYSEKQACEFLGVPYLDECNNNINKKLNKKVIGYCRVSTRKQKDDLSRQIELVRTYMIAKGYQFEMISDIGSGINYNNKGLNKLIKEVVNNNVKKVVILYKDRLVRFGFELIETVCKEFGVDIEIIDSTQKTDEQELVEDMIQIVTVFSCRLQGKRANKAKKILKEMESIEMHENKD